MKKISKTQAKEEIKNFFASIKEKDAKDVRKIRKLAMGYNIPLKDKRKTFCKKCLHPYKTAKVRIKKNTKTISCSHCNFVSRWKL